MNTCESFSTGQVLHSRVFQVAVPAMGISRRLRKSRRSGRFSNFHLFLLTVASAMKCQVQTVESGQYSYVASIFKLFSAIPFWKVVCLHLLTARCYVDDSNTCGDAKSSSFGAPFSWSCQACQSLAKKGESLTSEREQMHEGVELSCGFKLFLIKLIKKLTKWNPSLNGRHFQLSSFSLRECNPKLTDFSPRLPPSHSRGDTTHPPAHHTNQDFTSK